ERPGDIYNSRVDISKARQELGWMPQVSLTEGLKKTIEYYKAL
ncbi:MAG: GDP-mannose 4,6 dehydratase, partial [Candidatus Parcubacteria bacterium]